MNTLFENVKSAVSVSDAAAFYGINANRSGKIRCLFHPDRNPSMKLYEDHFYCFGCHKCGDVITFTAQLFNLSPQKAAEKLAADYGIVPPPEGYAGEGKPKIRIPEKDETLIQHIRLLSDYERLLRDWERDYAPASPLIESLDHRFIFACQELPWIEYMNDCINSLDEHMRSWADQELISLHLYERMEKMLSMYGKEVMPDGSDGKDAA